MRVNSIKEKNNSINKSSYKKNKFNALSNPISCSANVYFNSANSISNINKGLINSNNKISFQGSIDLNGTHITNIDIPKDCSEVNCNNISLNDSAKLESIKAGYQEDPLGFNDSDVGNVELYDNVEVKNIDAKSTTMYNSTSAENVSSKYLEMFNSARVKTVNSSNVELKDSSMIDNLNSASDLTIYGKGTIGNIKCKGNKIFITGPIKIDGQIKFDNAGDIILFKDKNNKYANITSNIQNGNVVFYVGNNSFINYKNIFEPGIVDTFNTLKEPYYRKKLGEFENINSLTSLYEKNNPKLAIKINKSTSNENRGKAENLYGNFIASTLQTLAYPEGKAFTIFWVNNKKLGNKNLTDFWLESLDKNTKNMSSKEKKDRLNNLTQKEKEKLIEVTTGEYIDNILPVELARTNSQDLSELENSDPFAQIKSKIQQSSKEELTKIIQGDDYQKLETVKIGHKNIIDFWIDAVDGEGTAQKYSIPQKKDRLIEIISSDANANKIYSSTLKENDKIAKHLNNVKEAYSKLIENSELSEPAKEILQKYQNNQLFFEIVNGNAEDKSSIVSIQKSTQDILNELETDREKAIQETRKNIFIPLRSFQYIADNYEQDDIENKISYVYSLIKDKIATSSQEEADKTKQQLIDLEDSINSNNKDDIEETWKNIVKTAQIYFEKEQINNVIDQGIKNIYTVQNANKNNIEPEIKSAMSNKTLSLAQRGFIARYKDDNNLVNLLKQPVNDYSNDINGFIALENLNVSIFDALSSEFRKNITPQLVGNLPEIPDLYIKELGYAPTKLSIKQKYDYLSKIPEEELNLIGQNVKNSWINNSLIKTISTNIRDKVKKFDIGYQTAQAASNLDKINIKMDDQNTSLLYIAQNIDKFIDKFDDAQSKTDVKLSKIINSLENIHVDTSNMKTNLKAMLFQSMESTKDPILKQEIFGLLQDSDKKDFRSFANDLDAKYKEYENSSEYKRKKFWNGVKKLAPTICMIGVAVAIPMIAPHIAALGIAHHAVTVTHIAHALQNTYISNFAYTTKNFAVNLLRDCGKIQPIA